MNPSIPPANRYFPFLQFLQALAAIWVLGMWFDMLTFAVPLNLGTLEGSRVVAFKAIG